ncbi:MAG: T9SS type A sorting domain-containing protein [Paludibacter sp.]
MRNTTFILLILLTLVGLTEKTSAQSNQQFVQGNDTLVVYKDVPGLAPSEFYTVRVRSAATNNQWVDCYANITRNLYRTITPCANSQRVGGYYFENTKSWSHTYANIEMSLNSQVEVEISPKNGFKINAQDFYKAAVHPSQRADSATISSGKVYFKLRNPASITVDINGQMDDYQPANKTPLVDVTDPNRIVHTITIFAHPVMNKPLETDPNVLLVDTNVIPPTNLGLKTIMYFRPGIHDLGLNFKLKPGIKYYIPGDAIVYGTLNNIGVPGNGALAYGDNIKIYGLGTISGDRINHPLLDFATAPTTSQTDIYKVINIENANNVVIEGVFVANNPYHGVHLSSPYENNTCRWVKVLSWRTNGDGIGDANFMEDCFLRTADDCSYIKGSKKRCYFWKDSNAAVFHFAGIPVNTKFVIEDCDVLYLRSTQNRSYGDGVFVQRIGGATGVQNVDVLFKNIRIHDKHPNIPVFNLVSYFPEFANNPTHRFYGVGSSFYGITFQNISIAAVYEGYGTGKSEQILGHADAPWYGGIVFDSVTIAGNKLSLSNFYTNAYVSDILFAKPRILTLTTSANVNQGSVARNLVQDTYLEASPVILTAIAKPGYAFSSWSGDASGTTNPLTVMIRGNMNITANFIAANITDPIVIDTPMSGSWVVPEGVNRAIFQVWGGGGAGGSAFGGTATTNTAARSGGGAGGSYASVSINLTPGQVVNYTVGAGGIGAAQGFIHQTKGDAGGTSFVSLNNSTIASALGGLGGENVSVTNLVYAGVGGVAPTAGNIGDVLYYGGNGGNASSTGSGGGGGSAGTQGNGGSGGSITAGIGGTGGGAAGGTGSNLNATAPTASGFPGGGGAGGLSRNSSPFTYNNLYEAGTSGANGKLIILLNQSTGLTTSVKENAFQIFPNPVKSVLSWNTNSNSNLIKIYSVNGVLLLQSSNTQCGSIDLSGLPKGMYFCQFRKGNQVIHTEKFIKE